jgi:hypothetical protein
MESSLVASIGDSQKPDVVQTYSLESALAS